MQKSATASGRPAAPFVGAGFLLGGILGFLTRPSAFLIGQLPFSAVLSRGGTLSGLDQILVPTAQASFNHMMFLAVLGAAVGFAVAWVSGRVKEEPRGSTATAAMAAPIRSVEPAVDVTAETLNNDRVLAMLASGLGDDVVIAKMERSRCLFALSSVDLAQLKQRGASDKVIAAMLHAMKTGITAVTMSLIACLAITACSRNRLTRDKAADLIRPQVVASMTLWIPARAYDDFSFLLVEDYVRGLADRGVVAISTNKDEPSYSSKKLIVAPTALATRFVVQQRVTFSDVTAPAVVLANAKLREVTGLRETDHAGKSAEVEFTWDWAPTPVGAALDGANLKRRAQSAVNVDVSRHYYPSKATCSLYDDGWRCELRGWERNHYLNDQL